MTTSQQITAWLFPGEEKVNPSNKKANAILWGALPFEAKLQALFNLTPPRFDSDEGCVIDIAGQPAQVVGNIIASAVLCYPNAVSYLLDAMDKALRKFGPSVWAFRQGCIVGLLKGAGAARLIEPPGGVENALLERVLNLVWQDSVEGEQFLDPMAGELSQAVASFFNWNSDNISRRKAVASFLRTTLGRYRGQDGYPSRGAHQLMNEFKYKLLNSLDENKTLELLAAAIE